MYVVYNRLLMLFAVSTLFSVGAMAQVLEEDQVRARILERVEPNILRVRVTDSGAPEVMVPGRVYEYLVTEETRFDDPTTYGAQPSFEDLQAGELVRLDLEERGTELRVVQATREAEGASEVTQAQEDFDPQAQEDFEEAQDVTATEDEPAASEEEIVAEETGEDETVVELGESVRGELEGTETASTERRLPATASPIPLLALIGFACAVMAFTLRLWRLRR